MGILPPCNSKQGTRHFDSSRGREEGSAGPCCFGAGISIRARADTTLRFCVRWLLAIQAVMASSHYGQRIAHRDAPGLAASCTLHCALFPFCPQPIGLFPPFGALARSFRFAGMHLCLENTGSSLGPALLGPLLISGCPSRTGIQNSYAGWAVGIFWKALRRPSAQGNPKAVLEGWLQGISSGGRKKLYYFTRSSLKCHA